MERRTIVGIYVSGRVEHVPNVQQVLTKFGCNIKTRIGLHEVTDGACSPNGLILLEMHGAGESIQEMEKALAAIPGVEVKEMVFGG